jgi:ABC-type polysaccharide/polyol phosphate transport system ATPase subunit
MSSDEIAISARGLGKRYRIEHKQKHSTLVEALLDRLRHPFAKADVDELWALSEASFDIPRGEVVGIVGRNGAGKSTLFKILSRITEPTCGEARIAGRVGSLIEVGTGFQPELTGRENIFLNGAILGMRRREIAKRFDEIVDFSGVERFLDTPVKHYSSGMYVRLAFAVAAHLDTDILLVDEVLSVGDAEFQKKSLGKMGDVASAGRTVIFVSHNLATLESLCTKGIFLEKGRIIRQGPLKETLAEYHRLIHPGDGSLLGGKSNLNGKYDFFRSIDLIDEEGHSARSVAMGTSVKVKFTVEFREPVEYPSFSVTVEGLLGDKVLKISSPRLHPSFTSLSGLCELTCDIGFLPLAPGDYGISLKLERGTTAMEETAVELHFNVRNADTFEDGWGFRGGVCVTNANWKIEDAVEDAAVSEAALP